MDHPGFARWLDAYVDAWRTCDPDAIGALFSEDAAYRYSPWGAPLTGREAIVAAWLESPDEPGTWEAAYEPWAVEGERGVAVGISRYHDADGEREFHNVFRCVFDSDGRCREFTEVFAQRDR